MGCFELMALTFYISGALLLAWLKEKYGIDVVLYRG